MCSDEVLQKQKKVRADYNMVGRRLTHLEWVLD
jgi:hypothetical protein